MAEELEISTTLLASVDWATSFVPLSYMYIANNTSVGQLVSKKFNCDLFHQLNAFNHQLLN